MKIATTLRSLGEAAGLISSKGFPSSTTAHPAAQSRPAGMSFAPAPRGGHSTDDAQGPTRFATLPGRGKGSSATAWTSLGKTLSKGANVLGKSARSAARQFGGALRLEDDRRGARRVNADGYDESDPYESTTQTPSRPRQSMFEQVIDDHARKQQAARRAPVMKEVVVDPADERERAAYHGVRPDFGRTVEVIDEDATAKRDAGLEQARQRAQDDSAWRRPGDPAKPRMHSRAPTWEEQDAADREADQAGLRRQRLPVKIPDEARYQRETAAYEQASAALRETRQAEKDSGVRRVPDVGELATRVKALNGQRRVKVAASSALDRDAARAGRKTITLTDLLASPSAIRPAAPSRRLAGEDAGPSTRHGVLGPPAPERFVKAESKPTPAAVAGRATVRDGAASSGAAPDRAGARTRAGVPSSRLGASRPGDVTRALDAELATRVADTFDVVPLDMLRGSGEPKHFERFARQLTNGTPYQAQADALAADGRLGTQVQRRLSQLAAMAEKRGVGLEALLRKQPAAAMDYVIERDSRSLGTAIKATKNPATRAPTAAPDREASPEASGAPTNDWRAARMRHEARRLGYPTEFTATLSEWVRETLLNARAKDEEALLHPRMNDLLAKSPLTSLLSDRALLQDFALEMTQGTYLEAKAKADADRKALGFNIETQFGLLGRMADKAGIGLEDLMRKHPGAVMEYLVEMQHDRIVPALKAHATEAGRSFP